MSTDVEKLYSLRVAAAKLGRAMDELMSIRARAERCTALYGSEPMGGGGSHDRVGDLAALAADKKEELNDLEYAYARLFRECELIIEKVEDPRRRDVLSMRFLQNLSVSEIARRRHYAESTVFKFQREGIRDIRTTETDSKR